MWVVPKFRTPALPQLTWWNPELRKQCAMQEHMLDPFALSGIPGGMEPSEYWFVDDCVPRGVLGAGVTDITVSVGTQRSVKLPSDLGGVPALMPQADSPQEEEGAAAGLGQPATCSAEGAGSAARELTRAPRTPERVGRGTVQGSVAKELKAVPSDPDKESWPTRIGRRTVQLAKEEKLTSLVPGCPNNEILV